MSFDKEVKEVKGVKELRSYDIEKGVKGGSLTPFFICCSLALGLSTRQLVNLSTRQLVNSFTRVIGTSVLWHSLGSMN